MMHATQSNNSKITCIQVWESTCKIYELRLERQESESFKVNDSFSL